ncbi:hypothetical protein [Nocardia tengchongensis]|uniref:hypothetical protein n=1 Tax=Nocardia tengchongensis TaxID=2055889 RepID=UPI0036C9498E
MTIGAELSGRVTTGVQQAALGRLNEPFSVGALSMVSAMKAFAPETSVVSAMKAFAPETSVASAMKALLPETSAVSAMKALAPETSIVSAMKAFAPETSVASAMKALAQTSTATFSASSVMQDVAKQLSSTVSTMDMGRFAATLQPDLALKSAVRAYQPDLSAPFLTFELPNVWKELGDRLQSQSDLNVWKDLRDQLRGAISLRVDIRTLREAAARVGERLRANFSRVIEYRQRAKAWVFGADTAARIRSGHKAREVFLRMWAAKRAEIAYGRAQLALREVGCTPPGRLVVARPHLTRGPNPCKSIRTHRLAGLLRT